MKRTGPLTLRKNMKLLFHNQTLFIPSQAHIEHSGGSENFEYCAYSISVNPRRFFQLKQSRFIYIYITPSLNVDFQIINEPQDLHILPSK